MDVHFSKTKDGWETPADFFNVMNNQFSYDIDVAADTENHQCPLWLGPGGVQEDALHCGWSLDKKVTYAWCNPPYSLNKQFLRKAAFEAEFCHVHSTLLIPARTDTKYFHEIIWPNASMVIFLKGRLKFGGAASGAPFPSMLVIFDGVRNGRPCVTTWDWRVDPFPLRP
jgi:phage N-6-adenine-methyltransferase